jgi:hypothetical protein
MSNELEVYDISDKTPSEKLEIIRGLYNLEDGQFALITMKSVIGGKTDYITRIYAGDTMKYHGSQYILFGSGKKAGMSDQGASAFCADKEMEKDISQSLGGKKEFEDWVEKSTDLYYFTGKKWRDLVKKAAELDSLVRHDTFFENFFRTYKNEFQWAMSDGRKENLLQNTKSSVPMYYLKGKKGNN